MNSKLKILVIIVIGVVLILSCIKICNIYLSDNNKTSTSGLVKLTLGEKNTNGGIRQKINDYEVIIPEQLVKVGYSIDIKNNILTITSNDNNYKFVMYQLTDNYIKPKQTEIDAFYESEEYLNVTNLYYDDVITLDECFRRQDNLRAEYFQKLGYNKINSPDYAMTPDELDEYRKDYLLTNDAKSTGYTMNTKYKYYDWGKLTIYPIQKEQEYKTSSFSAYIETFEYYENDEYNYRVYISTF